MTRRPLILLVALAVVGCQDPYTHDDAKPQRRDPQTRTVPRASSARAELAARRFAALWTNWTWQTTAATQRELSQLAVAPLARQLRANAASARVDATLARDRPASHGTVVAAQVRADGAAAHGLVVTREQSFTNGRADLGGRRYRVYLITATLRRGRWEVSRWAPQP